MTKPNKNGRVYTDDCFSNFDQLFSESFDEVFADMFSRKNPPIRLPLSKETRFSSQYEREGAVYIDTLVPGLSKDEVSVSFTDDALVIKGEPKPENTSQYAVKFEKRYRFAYGVHDMANIEASLNRGVLTVKIPTLKVMKYENKTFEIK